MPSTSTWAPWEVNDTTVPSNVLPIGGSATKVRKTIGSLRASGAPPERTAPLSDGRRSGPSSTCRPLVPDLVVLASLPAVGVLPALVVLPALAVLAVLADLADLVALSAVSVLVALVAFAVLVPLAAF